MIKKLVIALEERVSLIENEQELRDIFEDDWDDSVFHDDFIELIRMNENVIDDEKSLQWNVDKILGWVTFYKTKDEKYYMTNDF